MDLHAILKSVNPDILTDAELAPRRFRQILEKDAVGILVEALLLLLSGCGTDLLSRTSYEPALVLYSFVQKF